MRVDFKAIVFPPLFVSSGIGRATALLFAREGALVAVTARRDQELAALVAEITSSGGTAYAFPADVTDDTGAQPHFRSSSCLDCFFFCLHIYSK